MVNKDPEGTAWKLCFEKGSEVVVVVLFWFVFCLCHSWGYKKTPEISTVLSAITFTTFSKTELHVFIWEDTLSFERAVLFQFSYNGDGNKKSVEEGALRKGWRCASPFCCRNLELVSFSVPWNSAELKTSEELRVFESLVELESFSWVRF